MSSSLSLLIYRIICSINGKIYIGQSAQTLEARISDYRSHFRSFKGKSYIYEAMRKYGFDSFVFEQIDQATSYEELNQKERYWIAFYHTTDPKIGYNILAGGHGKPTHLDTRRKISASMKERYVKGHVPVNKGQKASDELKQCMSEGVQRSFRVKGYQNRPRKEIKCIETGEIYPSMNAAAKANGFSTASLTQYFRGKSKTCNGCHWEMTNNTTSQIYQTSKALNDLRETNSKRQKERKHTGRIQVQCIETGQVFASMAEAAIVYSIDKRLIFSAIERKIAAGGVHWIRLTPKRKHNSRGNPRRAIFCVDTGITYPSLTDASQSIGVNPTSIWCAIRDNSRSGGYQWRYATS